MNFVAKTLAEPSRRDLLTGALAGGFVLAFHLPAQAAPRVNEPQ